MKKLLIAAVIAITLIAGVLFYAASTAGNGVGGSIDWHNEG